MGSADWYARKLGGRAPSPQSGGASPGPTAPVPAPVPPSGGVTPSTPPSAPGSLSEALASPHTVTRGGSAAKTEHAACPECDSTNYFSRRNADNAKPRCYDCGYPVVQFGSPTGDGGLIQATQGGS